MNTATVATPTNLLGGIGAVTADILLEWFGFAALAFLASRPPSGAHAPCSGRGLNNVGWRALSWPASVIMIAGGLSELPAPVASSSRPVAAVRSAWLSPISASGSRPRMAPHSSARCFTIAIAGRWRVAGRDRLRGLQFKPFGSRAALSVAAFFVWIGRMIHIPAALRAHDYNDEEEAYEEHDEPDEEDDAYGLAIRPEPVAAHRPTTTRALAA